VTPLTVFSSTNYLFIGHVNEISIWLIYNLSQMNLHHFNNYIDRKKIYIWHSKYLINALIQFIEGKYGFVQIDVESHKENENNNFEYQSWLHNIVHQDWFYAYHNLMCIS
jgi:hypothetical protein